MKMIFDYLDYKAYLRDYKKDSSSKNGRGFFSNLAKAAGMQPSNLSLIFTGSKDLSLEQADAIARHLELNHLESDYFFALVSYARAGTKELKLRTKRHLSQLKGQNKQLSSRLYSEDSLSPLQASIFYSQWYFSAVHILTFLPQFQTVSAIAAQLNLSQSMVKNVVSFLLKNKLLREENGTLRPSTRHTHLEANSWMISIHHQNWRMKAAERHPHMSQERELRYSSQMALSIEDAAAVREYCMKLIENTRKTVDPSPSESVFCLNLDWFRLA